MQTKSSYQINIHQHLKLKVKLTPRFNSSFRLEKERIAKETDFSDINELNILVLSAIKFRHALSHILDRKTFGLGQTITLLKFLLMNNPKEDDKVQ